jgi:hypothetical protein
MSDDIPESAMAAARECYLDEFRSPTDRNEHLEGQELEEVRAIARAMHAYAEQRVAEALYKERFPKCINNAHCQSRREHGDGECGCFHDSIALALSGFKPDPEKRLWTKVQLEQRVTEAVRAERVSALREAEEYIKGYAAAVRRAGHTDCANTLISVMTTIGEMRARAERKG